MISANEARTYISEDQDLAEKHAHRVAKKMLQHIAEPSIWKAVWKHCHRAHAAGNYDEMMDMCFNTACVCRSSHNGMNDMHIQDVEEKSVKYASEMLREAGYEGGFWIDVQGKSLYNGGQGTTKLLMFEAKF